MSINDDGGLDFGYGQTIPFVAVPENIVDAPPWDDDQSGWTIDPPIVSLEFFGDVLPMNVPEDGLKSLPPREDQIRDLLSRHVDPKP